MDLKRKQELADLICKSITSTTTTDVMSAWGELASFYIPTDILTQVICCCEVPYVVKTSADIISTRPDLYNELEVEIVCLCEDKEIVKAAWNRLSARDISAAHLYDIILVNESNTQDIILQAWDRLKKKKGIRRAQLLMIGRDCQCSEVAEAAKQMIKPKYGIYL